MSDSTRPNVLVRLWLGFWRGLTAIRIAVFNILFLFVLALVIGALISSGDKLVIESDTTLVLAPAGVIVEEFSGTALDRAIGEALGQEPMETRLRDLLRVLDEAAEDDRITQVLIDTDRFMGMGTATMREISTAFARFRESGKPIIAHGGTMTQGQYLLASQADEIWLDQDGILILEGFSRFRNFYREGLDKLEVEVNLFKTGDYKTFADVYERNDMSPADREASETLLAGLWQEYLSMVAANRGMPVEVLDEITQHFGEHFRRADGHFGRMALELGLVDRLVSRPELRAELARRGAPDNNGSFRQVGHDDFLRPQLPTLRPHPGVGVIVAEGGIVEGSQPPGMIGGDSTAALIRQAASDDNIRAVVLRVNSGGGSAFASEVIRRELQALRDAGKPVVVSMGNVAASGGYWIAMSADEVWASPATITGSIGVVGFLPTFEDTLGRIGIHTDGVGTTPLAGALRADRSMSPELRELFGLLIDSAYRDFLTLVASSRQMSVESVHAVAQGRVWTGTQALERGLIDQLGNLDDAIAAAARIAGLGDDYSVSYVERELQPWQKFLSQIGARAMIAAGYQPLESRLLGMLPRELRRSLLDDLSVIMSASRPGTPGVIAHCLCDGPLY